MIVKSLRNHPYNGKIRRTGSEYEIKNPSDLKLLIAIKAVCKVEKKEPVKACAVLAQDNERAYEINDTVPEKTETTEPKVAYQGKKRGRKPFKEKGDTYDRKDMVAQSNY